MKMSMYSPILLLSLLSCGWSRSSGAPAQLALQPEQFVEEVQLDQADGQGKISWDKTLHDFGDVSVSDGPLSCTFTLTNTGQEAITIFEVVSSCGCTDVQWTRDPLMPGQSGTISATYQNEDGALAFDKTLTVYISGVKRPVVLRLRGVVHDKKKSLSELYGAEKLGDFGIKSRSLKTGTLHQGLSVSETATVANLGRKPLEVGFESVSPQLTMSVSPNPIPVGSTATLTYTVRADASLFGRNEYSAVPVLNGKKAPEILSVTAWTQENFALWSQEQRENAALPMFDTSTFNFGIIDDGKSIDVSFPCLNKGKSTLHFYKADTEKMALELAGSLPEIEAGKKGSVRFTLDTSLLPKGENVIMISLTTNSPLRPLVNLFVAGEIR